MVEEGWGRAKNPSCSAPFTCHTLAISPTFCRWRHSGQRGEHFLRGTQTVGNRAGVQLKLLSLKCPCFKSTHLPLWDFFGRGGVYTGGFCAPYVTRMSTQDPAHGLTGSIEILNNFWIRGPGKCVAGPRSGLPRWRFVCLVAQLCLTVCEPMDCGFFCP